MCLAETGGAEADSGTWTSIPSLALADDLGTDGSLTLVGDDASLTVNDATPAERVGISRAEYLLKLNDDFCWSQQLTFDDKSAARQRRRLRLTPAEASTVHLPSVFSAHRRVQKAGVVAYSQVVADAAVSCTTTACIRDALVAYHPPPPPPSLPYSSLGLSEWRSTEVQPLVSTETSVRVMRWASVPSRGEWTRIILPVTAFAAELFLVGVEPADLPTDLSLLSPPLVGCSEPGPECEPPSNSDQVWVGFHRRLDLLLAAGLVDRFGRPDWSRCATIEASGGKAGLF